jgi:hypothetical protein
MNDRSAGCSRGAARNVDPRLSGATLHGIVYHSRLLDAFPPAGGTVRRGDGRSSQMRKYLNPLRLTTLLLVLYCLGHTLSALVSTPPFGAQSDAVAAAMKSVHFEFSGSVCTWYGFYLGFGYEVSIFFLFSGVLTWFLGGMSLPDQRRWAPILWALFVSYSATIVLAVRYLFIVPIVFSSLITLLLGLQGVRVARAPRMAEK